MTDKSLASKAIDIKGKDYVQVKDRVIYFNDTYPNGSIITELKSEPGDEMVVIKAKVTPDLDKPERYFTGYSQAKWGEGMVNRTAALENAETSAVGRALALMGIGVLDSVASADEIVKATNIQKDESTSKVAEEVFSEDFVVCPDHRTKVYSGISKTGNKYYLCKAGNARHFINIPQDSEFDKGYQSQFENERRSYEN